MPPAMSFPEKNLGLSRLRAESRRFQNELLCINSSLCCPHHHCHHGADSSEASSDNSAWDSPQVLKQLAIISDRAKSFLPSIDASVQASINEKRATSDVPDRISCRHYSVESPISVTTSVQRNFSSDHEIAASTTPVAEHHQDFFERDISRITATAIFTANAGKLVLNVPRPFSNDSKGLLQKCTLNNTESERERVDEIIQYRDLGGGSLGREQVMQRESSTSLMFINDSIHHYGGSMLCDEENKSSDAVKDLKAVGDKGLVECNDSGIFGHHTQSTTANKSSVVIQNMDALVQKLKSEEHSSTSNLIKLNEAGKDKALAKRMAARIKLILQSLDSNKQGSHGNPRYGILSHGTSSRKSPDCLSNIVDTNLVRKFGHSEQNHLKGEGIPDPESYLQDVVSALSVSKCRSGTESFQEQRTAIEYESKEIMCDLLTQSAKYESSNKHSRNKDECTQIELTRIGGEISGTKPDDIEDSCIGRLTDPQKPEEPECTQGSNILGEAMDHQAEIHNSIFREEMDDRVLSQGDKNVIPNNDFLQSCRQKVTDLLEGNIILEKQLRRMGAMQNTWNSQELTIIQHESQMSNIQEQPNQVGFQKLTNLRDIEDGSSSPDATFPIASRNEKKYQSKRRSRNSSILDSPIQAAVQAASDLAKHLAHGTASNFASVTEEQLSDSQNQRTKSATKAVQVLVGDKFDYSSMYQDLKSLQVERRKLEIRAKTTFQFQGSSNDAGVVSKQQDRISSQRLLRRRAADGGDSASDTKRQRTTKSPDCVRNPENKYAKKHEVMEKKHTFPTLISSLGISMTDHWDLGFEHPFPTTMTDGKRKVPVHMRMQTQGMSKLRFHKTKSKCQVQVNHKRYTTPPDWVERMSQGRPSHDVHEFQAKDQIGKAITKNLVIRRSVRPPGSIFKSSNRIQWTSETSVIKKPGLQQKGNGSVQAAECSKLKSKGPKKSVFETGCSSKTAQESSGEEEANTCHAETGKNAASQPSPNASIQKIKDEKQNHKVVELSNEEFNCEEMVSRDTIANKLYIENLIREIAEESLHENVKYEKKVSFSSMNLALEKNAVESSSTDSVDDYKKKLEDEVTQGALLAITLQSILNKQSIDNDDNRNVVELSGDLPSNTFQSVKTESKVNNNERMQDCKGVQTTDNNSLVPGNAMIPPFPFFPSFHLPDGNIYPNPSMFCGCPYGNFRCNNCEKTKSSTMASDIDTNKQIFVDMKSEQKKSTQNNHVSSYSTCVRHKESLSSVTTPSSPASIHEIEDLCETGWNDVSDTLGATIPLRQENELGNSHLVDAVMHNHMLSNESRGEQVGANAITLEEKNDEHEVELKHHSNKKTIKQQQVKKVGSSHSQIELDVMTQQQIEKGKSKLMAISLAEQVPHFRMTGEEELHINKRFSLMPLNDHIYPSVRNHTNRPLAKLEMFPGVRENQKDLFHFVEGAIVPSWSEIKRPVRVASSSESFSTTSIDETSSFSTISSVSLGELQSKAFAILEHSISTNHHGTREQSNKVQEKSMSDACEGELTRVDVQPFSEDLVELGEVVLETPRLVDFDYNGFSEGELHFW